jgi:hypothetical protein
MDRHALTTAFQDAYSPLLAATPLRYKRKMIGFRHPGPGGVPTGHVAYCMMTFVIRNQLPQLQDDHRRYIKAVRSLTKSWKLDSAAAARIHEFAVKWATWSASRMGQIVECGKEQYLTCAEQFVDDFLAAPLGPATRSFYGNALLVGFDDAFVQEVQARTGAVQVAEVTEVTSKVKWDARSAAEFGTIIKWNALSPWVRPSGRRCR